MESTSHIRKTHEQFVDEIAELFPDLEVISSYNGQKKPIRVKDGMGIEYETKPVYLIAKQYPRIVSSAIDKTEAFKLKLARACPDYKIKIVGEFVSTEAKILVEDEDGVRYLTTPWSMLQAKSPSIEIAEDKNEAFKIKSQKIHGNKYDYSKVDYVGYNVKAKIGCPIHGFFMQSLAGHLRSNYGCPKCGHEKTNEAVRYNMFNRPNWIKYCTDKKRKSYVYIIKCYDDNETFVKIGITARKLYDRFYNSNLPYKYKLIGKISGEPGFVHDMEKTLHEKYSDQKYSPLKKFGGSRECFNIKILDNICWEQSKLFN